MTTERDRKNNSVEFICDFCGERYTDESVYNSEDFSYAWNELKRKGWRTFKDASVSDDWVHKCGDCIKRQNT